MGRKRWLIFRGALNIWKRKTGGLAKMRRRRGVGAARSTPRLYNSQGMAQCHLRTPCSSSAAVAISSGDSIARVWDILSGQEITQLTHEGHIGELVFNLGEDTLATLSGDRTVRV